MKEINLLHSAVKEFMQNQNQFKQDVNINIHRKHNVIKSMTIKLKEGTFNKNDLIELIRVSSNSLLSTYWQYILELSQEGQDINIQNIQKEIHNIERKILINQGMIK